MPGSDIVDNADLAFPSTARLVLEKLKACLDHGDYSTEKERHESSLVAATGTTYDGGPRPKSSRTSAVTVRRRGRVRITLNNASLTLNLTLILEN